MRFLASPIKTTCTHILALLPEKAEDVVAKDEQQLGTGEPPRTTAEKILHSS